MSDWIDQPTKIRKGEDLNIESLQKYLNKQLPQHAGELVIEQFPGGYSNLTYLIKLGDTQFVLRRPPFGAKIKSAHDMGREYKILSALSKHWSKAPKPEVYTEDESIIGSPFYVMERVQGVILRPKMPKEMTPDAPTMSGISKALANTFAELHQVDYEAAGLGDLGKPNGYVERQITGWTKRYFKSKTNEIPEIEKVAKWLADHLPEENKPALIHNDFKYDNVILDPNDWTNIIAVLDWEMSTLGDPLMDLGTSIGYWFSPNDPDWMKQMSLSPTDLPGNPTRGEFVELYAKASGRDVGNILFYYVYGVFKIAVVAQQIYYRYHKGFTQDERFAKMILAVQGLANVGTRAIEKKRIDDLY